jgi:hypothetical protein
MDNAFDHHMQVFILVLCCCCLLCVQLPQGSGPFGLLVPGDVTGVLQGVQSALASSAPQLQGLMQQPGATELLTDVSRQLAQRFAARTIKFTFGLGNMPSARAAEAGAA